MAIITLTPELNGVLNRLSAAALSSNGDDCSVSKNDLGHLLLAYNIEVAKTDRQ
jgi:hypothetical protein